jgi:hypothetical protein
MYKLNEVSNISCTALVTATVFRMYCSTHPCFVGEKRAAAVSIAGVYLAAASAQLRVPCTKNFKRSQQEWRRVVFIESRRVRIYADFTSVQSYSDNG